MRLPGFIRKAVSFITKGGSERLVLLLSLTIAFLIWFVHTFSLSYSQYFNYIVNVKTNIEGRTQESQSKEMLIIRGRSTGFFLLKERSSSESQLTVNIDPKLFKPYNLDRDIFYLTGNDIRDRIIEALNGDVDVEYIATDTLLFEFPEILHKSVPIVPKSDITYKSQYMPVSRMTIDPKEIIIYGEQDLLSRIDTIFTELISLKYVARSVQGIIPLAKIKGIRFSEDQIFYSMDVDRYIEQYIDVPVNTVNVPHGKLLKTLPSTIRVFYRRSFNDNREINNYSFLYTIDYLDYLNTIDSKMIPSPSKTPEGLYLYFIDPMYVECFLVDQQI